MAEGGDLHTLDCAADLVVHRFLVCPGALSGGIAEYTGELLQGCEAPLLFASGGLREVGQVEPGVPVSARARSGSDLLGLAQPTVTVVGSGICLSGEVFAFFGEPGNGDAALADLHSGDLLRGFCHVFSDPFVFSSGRTVYGDIEYAQRAN